MNPDTFIHIYFGSLLLGLVIGAIITGVMNAISPKKDMFDFFPLAIAYLIWPVALPFAILCSIIYGLYLVSRHITKRLSNK